MNKSQIKIFHVFLCKFHGSVFVMVNGAELFHCDGGIDIKKQKINLYPDIG